MKAKRMALWVSIILCIIFFGFPWVRVYYNHGFRVTVEECGKVYAGYKCPYCGGEVLDVGSAKCPGCNRTVRLGYEAKFVGTAKEGDYCIHKYECPRCGYILKVRGNKRKGKSSNYPYSPPASCFISTAAFGTPLSKEVIVLQEFRDRYLMTNIVGRFFVAVYCRISPPMAQFIAKSESRRAFVRISLTPLVKIAKLAISEEVMERDRSKTLELIFLLFSSLIISFSVYNAFKIFRSSKSRMR